MGEQILKVSCPCCKNGRLFDVLPDTEGTIQIKCPCCRKIIQISLHNKKIRTERILSLIHI